MSYRSKVKFRVIVSKAQLVMVMRSVWPRSSIDENILVLHCKFSDGRTTNCPGRRTLSLCYYSHLKSNQTAIYWTSAKHLARDKSSYRDIIFLVRKHIFRAGRCRTQTQFIHHSALAETWRASGVTIQGSRRPAAEAIKCPLQFFVGRGHGDGLLCDGLTIYTTLFDLGSHKTFNKYWEEKTNKQINQSQHSPHIRKDIGLRQTCINMNSLQRRFLDAKYLCIKLCLSKLAAKIAKVCCATVYF